MVTLGGEKLRVDRPTLPQGSHLKSKVATVRGLPGRAIARAMKDTDGLSPTEIKRQPGAKHRRTRAERDALSAASGLGLKSLQARAEHLGVRSIGELPSFVLTNTIEAALLLGRPVKQLEAWRSRGLGPRYVRRGRRIGYPLGELRRFAMCD